MSFSREPPPKWERWLFTPQPDLTAFELAEIMVRITGWTGGIVLVKRGETPIHPRHWRKETP